MYKLNGNINSQQMQTWYCESCLYNHSCSKRAPQLRTKNANST